MANQTEKVGYINPVKKQRAIDELKKEARSRGEDMSKFVPDEAEVKRKYLAFGGLYIDKAEGVFQHKEA